MNDGVAGEPARSGAGLGRWYRQIVIGWLVYWAILTYLLLAPKLPRAPITISPKGLVIHFCTFAFLAYAGVLVRRAARARCTVGWALAWACVYVAYGGLAELIQPLTGRSTDIEDFIANTLGSTIVLAIAVAFSRRRSTSR